MRKLASALGAALLLAVAMAAASAPVLGATTCTQTGYVRDSINLTAAQIGGAVTSALDATGCNIGVYFDSANPGSVSGAEIYGANYYGVVVNGGNVDVTGSAIHDIGETPFNGTQHGVAIYYAYGSSSTGTVSGNTISDYQKGGIVANGTGTFVTITDNTVTGLGPVGFIAQNGIQIGWGAVGQVTGNTVTGNDYTPVTWSACGLLFYQAGGGLGQASSNELSDNERDVCTAGGGPAVIPGP